MKKATISENSGFMANPQTIEEFDWQARFSAEIEAESSRGMVLNITSFIDELLVKLLSSYFPNSAHADWLLSRMDGCLGSIMDRANIAYALSLLRKKEFDAIKIIARIRNEFAHKWDQTEFDSGKVLGLIGKFPQHYFEYADGTNKAKFKLVSFDVIQELLARYKYAKIINDRLPKEYQDIFDLPLENRQKILARRRG